MDAFYALAEPRRRKIVEVLASRGQLSATQISDEFEVTPQAISQHLGVLREANVIRMERSAQQRIYGLDTSSMSEIERWTRSVTTMWNRRLGRLEKALKEEALRGGKTD
jgi:DNA-binding transcriptional ArsR family regulator